MSSNNKNNIKIGIIIAVLVFAAIYISIHISNQDEYVQKVTPLIPNADLPYKNYTINSDSLSFLKTPTGTKIKVQPGSFVHKDGKIVTGSVSFKLREMHNAYDILQSGIPMSLSQKREGFLESAGMIEMHAFQNNEELEVNPQKNIDVQLAAYKPSEGYQLYYLENNNWQTKDTFLTVQNIEKQEKLIRLNKLPVPPNETDTLGDIIFELAASEIDAPYLKPFQNIQWKIKSEEATPQVRQQLRVNWDEVSIKEVNRRKMKYELTFIKKVLIPTDTGIDYQTSTKKLVLNATPIMNEKTKRKDRKSFAVQMKEYNDYITKIAEEKIRVEKEADLLNAFKINKMGIWNIDCLQRQSEVIFTKINFDFQNEIDPTVNKIKVYVIFEKSNSVVQYLPKDFNIIGIPASMEVSIVAVLPNNNIAFVDDEQIKEKMKKNNQNLFLSTKKIKSNQFFLNDFLVKN